jgi:hypothetical protein
MDTCKDSYTIFNASDITHMLIKARDKYLMVYNNLNQYEDLDCSNLNDSIINSLKRDIDILSSSNIDLNTIRNAIIDNTIDFVGDTNFIEFEIKDQENSNDILYNRICNIINKYNI